jgi:hypothetical protein
MGRGDSTRASVANEDRHAIRRHDGQRHRRIIPGDDVCRDERAGGNRADGLEQNVGAVDLAGTRHMLGLRVDGLGDLAPRVRSGRRRGSEEPRSVREEMARERLERPADE